MTPIIGHDSSISLHVLMLKSSKAVGWTKWVRFRETISQSPFGVQTDKDKIVPYIQTLHKINKELWPQAGITRTYPPPLSEVAHPTSGVYFCSRSSPGSE